MREIRAESIVNAVSDAAIRANLELGRDVMEALERAVGLEESEVGRDILKKLLENARIAREERIPICQDTGVAVLFVELGREARVIGDLYQALEEGVRKGYEQGFLRKSVCDPFTRKNTGDNTPVIVHLSLVPGDRLRIWMVPKGGGSENMSRLFMLPPSAGWAGVKEKVVQTVAEAGPNPCPPTIIGVGIGGDFEQSAILAKKSLLRPLGSPNPDPRLVPMEEELLTDVNRTGVGPQGLGGRVTSLAVHILMMPCHIASLPLAVNIQCHASRHVEIVL
ncbi:MAG: fumarate hydratase [Deltaproteobacteria bacterium]|nr:fumarate hydratase [Deltaproteobacteria bacterium]